LPPLAQCGAQLLPLSMKSGMKNPVALVPYTHASDLRGIREASSGPYAIWAVAAVVSRQKARTIAAILCAETRLTDFYLGCFRCHRDGTDQPKRACRLEADDFGCLLLLFCHPSWSISGYTRVRNLGRLLYLYAKLDYFPALFWGNPNRLSPENVRYVELDYLCHIIPTFFSKPPIADVGACNRTAALHGSRFAPMRSAFTLVTADASLRPVFGSYEMFDSAARVLDWG